MADEAIVEDPEDREEDFPEDYLRFSRSSRILSQDKVRESQHREDVERQGATDQEGPRAAEDHLKGGEDHH